MNEDIFGKKHYITNNVYFNCSWDGTQLNLYRVNLCYTKLKDNNFILLLTVVRGLSREKCEKLISDIIVDNRFIQSDKHIIIAPKIKSTFEIKIITFSKPKITNVPWFEHTKYTDSAFENKVNGLLVYS